MTAVVIYLLALRGGVQGYRLVLVGIGIAAVLQAINAYLVARATREDAYEAAHLDDRQRQRARLGARVAGRRRARRAGAGGARPGAAAARCWRWATTRRGRSASRAERSRLALAFVAVGLTAVATASTGPIAFVALAAPQIARRLTHVGRRRDSSRRR